MINNLKVESFFGWVQCSVVGPSGLRKRTKGQ